MASAVGPTYWFNHTGCLRDRDLDMDRWVLWFHVEPLTVHLNRDRDQYLLSPIVLVPVPVPAVPVPDTASVITPCSEFGYKCVSKY